MSPKRDRDNQHLSTSDAAEILGITPDGVRYLERRGQLRAVLRLASGQFVFRREDVERLAAKRRTDRGDLKPVA